MDFRLGEQAEMMGREVRAFLADFMTNALLPQEQRATPEAGH